MNKPFTAAEVLPGVWQIRDRMLVCMTLLVGTEAALLVDTGYGTDDVNAFVRTITGAKPLSVMLTHGHHDHALGCRWFDEVSILAEDLPVYETYTAEAQRRAVKVQADARGIAVPGDFLTSPMARPLPLREGAIALGGLTAVVHAVPGHTPGSAVVEVPERALLLTGDNWNPCTWLYFPECMPVRTYRKNMRRILRLFFTSVLCAHQPGLFGRREIDVFFASLTDEALAAAEPADMWRPIRTHRLMLPDAQQLVFDFDKFESQ